METKLRPARDVGELSGGVIPNRQALARHIRRGAIPSNCILKLDGRTFLRTAAFLEWLHGPQGPPPGGETGAAEAGR
jgi:hypothetical protein